MYDIYISCALKKQPSYPNWILLHSFANNKESSNISGVLEVKVK
jgi:hypothetical protein